MGRWPMVSSMDAPDIPVTVTPEQLAELNKQLSRMRHEINNQLALAVAALELIRFRPELREKMLDTIAQQSPKITAEVAKFSAAFEQTFGIKREGEQFGADQLSDKPVG